MTGYSSNDLQGYWLAIDLGQERESYCQFIEEGGNKTWEEFSNSIYRDPASTHHSNNGDYSCSTQTSIVQVHMNYGDSPNGEGDDFGQVLQMVRQNDSALRKADAVITTQISATPPATAEGSYTYIKGSPCSSYLTGYTPGAPPTPGLITIDAGRLWALVYNISGDTFATYPVTWHTAKPSCVQVFKPSDSQIVLFDMDWHGDSGNYAFTLQAQHGSCDPILVNKGSSPAGGGWHAKRL